ncbi:L-type lectin family protein, partial [Streptomyces sp. DT9]
MATQTASSTTRPATAGFPVIEPFDKLPLTHDWKLDGNATVSDGSLKLTGDEKNTAGTALLEEAFSTEYGITIDFDYCVQGSESQNFGDGFCVYLIDGSTTTKHGGYGAGLGYSIMHASSVSQPGVTGGYVGIGFDDWGNYATTFAGPGGSQDRKPDTLGIRGSGNLQKGFNWLIGEKVDAGFRSSWVDQAHAHISIVDRRITVRLSSKANPSGTTVIDGYDLRSAGGQVPLPKTFKLGLSAGTGNAHAAHRLRNLKVALPVEIPLTMNGPASAKSGQSITYTVNAQNNGPNDCPDARIEGTFPDHVSATHVECADKGKATHGQPKIEGRKFALPVSLPKPDGTNTSTVTVTLGCTIGGDYTGTLYCQSRVDAGSCTNTARQHEGSITTTVTAIVIESPVITEPKDTASVSDARQPIRGTVPDADQVTLTESGKDLG